MNLNREGVLHLVTKIVERDPDLRIEDIADDSVLFKRIDNVEEVHCFSVYNAIVDPSKFLRSNSVHVVYTVMEELPLETVYKKEADLDLADVDSLVLSIKTILNYRGADSAYNRSTHKKYIDQLKALGCNIVSMGVDTLDGGRTTAEIDGIEVVFTHDKVVVGNKYSLTLVHSASEMFIKSVANIIKEYQSRSETIYI